MRPLVLLLLALLPGCAAVPSAGSAGLLGLTDAAAREAIGHEAVITGQVVQVKTAAHHGFAYLNFGGRYPAHTFSVLIPDTAMAQFGDLARFEGHRVRATGIVWLQDQGWPAMILTDPSALEHLP